MIAGWEGSEFHEKKRMDRIGRVRVQKEKEMIEGKNITRSG